MHGPSGTIKRICELNTFARKENGVQAQCCQAGQQKFASSMHLQDRNACSTSGVLGLLLTTSQHNAMLVAV